MDRLFRETTRFTELIRTRAISDGLVRRLEEDIMEGKGAVIPGTGGIRKIRMATERGGKRGGYRVLFADYPEFGVCVLITLFAKVEKSNVTAAEALQMKKAKMMLDSEIRRAYGRRRR